jgi:hypothetical protein
MNQVQIKVKINMVIHIIHIEHIEAKIIRIIILTMLIQIREIIIIKIKKVKRIMISKMKMFKIQNLRKNEQKDQLLNNNGKIIEIKLIKDKIKNININLNSKER